VQSTLEARETAVGRSRVFLSWFHNGRTFERGRVLREAGAPRQHAKPNGIPRARNKEGGRGFHPKLGPGHGARYKIAPRPDTS
jgi:hypothetical protein